MTRAVRCASVAARHDRRVTSSPFPPLSMSSSLALAASQPAPHCETSGISSPVVRCTAPHRLPCAVGSGGGRVAVRMDPLFGLKAAELRPRRRSSTLVASVFPSPATLDGSGAPPKGTDGSPPAATTAPPAASHPASPPTSPIPTISWQDVMDVPRASAAASPPRLSVPLASSPPHRCRRATGAAGGDAAGGGGGGARRRPRTAAAAEAAERRDSLLVGWPAGPATAASGGGRAAAAAAAAAATAALYPRDVTTTPGAGEGRHPALRSPPFPSPPPLPLQAVGLGNRVSLLGGWGLDRRPAVGRRPTSLPHASVGGRGGGMTGRHPGVRSTGGPAFGHIPAASGNSGSLGDGGGRGGRGGGSGGVGGGRGGGGPTSVPRIFSASMAATGGAPARPGGGGAATLRSRLFGAPPLTAGGGSVAGSGGGGGSSGSSISISGGTGGATVAAADSGGRGSSLQRRSLGRRPSSASSGSLDRRHSPGGGAASPLSGDYTASWPDASGSWPGGAAAARRRAAAAAVAAVTPGHSSPLEELEMDGGEADGSGSAWFAPSPPPPPPSAAASAAAAASGWMTGAATPSSPVTPLPRSDASTPGVWGGNWPPSGLTTGGNGGGGGGTGSSTTGATVPPPPPSSPPCSSSPPPSSAPPFLPAGAAPPPRRIGCIGRQPRLNAATLGALVEVAAAPPSAMARLDARLPEGGETLPTAAPAAAPAVGGA